MIFFAAFSGAVFGVLIGLYSLLRLEEALDDEKVIDIYD